MKTDILFVVPSTKPNLKDESIGTLILAKKAIMAGFSAKIVRFWEASQNLSNYTLFCKDMVYYIMGEHPLILSFYCRCSDYHICLDLSRRIKEIDSSIKIVFGGPQAELVARETLEYFPFVDYVCCSEGENTIVPLLDNIITKKNNIDYSKVLGLTYRNNDNQIEQNDFPELLPNNYIRGFSYYDLIPQQVIENNKGTNIDVGRGCPFNCSFCSTKTFWRKKYRLRNIEDIVKEIQELWDNYRIRNYSFDHDLFTVNHVKIKEFCRLIKDKGLDIEWYCSSRIDTITEELIDVMKDAGCYKILYGIETGSPRMQKIINKNLELDKCESVIKYTLAKGLKVVASFIYGFPEDSEEDFEYTFELMQKLQSLGAKTIAWRCGILNGTEMYERYKNNLTIEGGNAFNSSFWGFDELFPMIKKHKDVFPHFYEFQNNLRSELVYLEIFRSIWNYYDSNTYNRMCSYFINCKYPLLEMYRSFVKVNHSVLESIHQKPEDIYWGATLEECELMTLNFLNYHLPTILR